MSDERGALHPRTPATSARRRAFTAYPGGQLVRALSRTQRQPQAPSSGEG